MDPLSITASTITLIQATGAVATVLGKFAHGLKTVDSRVTGLNDELSHLTGFLTAIESTLNGCQSLDLDLADDRLWHQSEIALVNCQITLNELSILVNKISRSSNSRGFRWKSRAVVDLNIHNEALASYRDKIHQSNSALQTILHAITVKLSLTNKVSQDQILWQLDQLKASIDQALYTSSRPVGGLIDCAGGCCIGYGQPVEQKLTRNLRNLAVEAQHFYTAASSTTGTIRSRDSNPYWMPSPDPQLSIMGDFSALNQTRVEQFLELGEECLPPETEPSTPVNSPPPSKSIPFSHEPRACSGPVKEMKMVQGEEEDEEEEDNAELEQAFLTGLRELAVSSIKTMDYTKAIAFLQEAMSQEEPYKGGKSGEKNNQDQLKTQLALCHLFQGSWRQAEELVNELRDSQGSSDIIVCNLLHTLALGYLNEYSLQEALKICKMALLGKKRYCKKNEISSWAEYHETLGLFATIFDVTGDYIRAEVFNRKIPADFVYRHPSSPSEFLKSKKELLISVLGDNVPDFEPHRSPRGPVELQGSLGTIKRIEEVPTDVGMHSSNWHLKVSKHEKYELDTLKEAVTGIPESPCYADDEASPTEHQESPILKHFNRFLGRRNHLSADTEGIHPNRVYYDTSDSSPSALSPSRMRWLARRNMFQGKRRKVEKDFSQPRVEIIKTYTDAFQTEDGDNSFKLLAMKRVATPLSGELERRFSWSSEKFFPSLEESQLQDEASVHGQETIKEEFDLCLLSQSIPSPYLDASTDDGKSTGVVASSSSSDRSSSPSRNKTQGAYPELGGSQLSLRKAGVSLPRARKSSRTIKMSLPKLGVSELDGRIIRPEIKVSLPRARVSFRTVKTPLPKLKILKSDSSIISHKPPSKVASRHLDRGVVREGSPGRGWKPAIAHHDKQSTVTLNSPDDILVSSSMGCTKKEHEDEMKDIQPAQPLDVLSQVAIILASLENPKSIRYSEDALISLLPDLKAMSHDRVFINDIERIIRTLGQKSQFEEPFGNDSGYESAPRGREDETAASCKSLSILTDTNADISGIKPKHPWDRGSDLATVASAKDSRASDITNESMAGPKGTEAKPSTSDTGVHGVTADEFTGTGKGLESSRRPYQRLISIYNKAYRQSPADSSLLRPRWHKLS